MDSLRPGDPVRIGDYVLSGRLGAGGMGEVFFGRSPGGRPVAVKLISPVFADDPEFRRRFRLEVEAGRRVGGFHTAQVVDADPSADRPWIVTAYVKGPSLAQVLTHYHALPLRSIRVLGAGLAEALAAIHAAGIIHTDLKPSNILLADDGPRVIDFGIARAIDASGITARPGSPGFVAPEVLRGHAITAACDVFSLGVVLAFAGGVRPFGEGPAEAIDYRVVYEEPDLRGLDPQIRGLVAECLAKKPAERPTPAQILGRLAVGGSVEQWLPDPVEDMIIAGAPHEPAALGDNRRLDDSSGVSAGDGGGSAGGSSSARGGSGGGGGCGGDDGWIPPARPRYLVGQCQESVAVGKPFSLLASIVLAANPMSAELEPFDVPPQGQDVLLVLYAPRLRVLSDQQQSVHVPADRDSRPVRFELRADTPGPVIVSITAWIGGSHLGELRVEIMAERDRAPGPHQEVLAEISTQPTAGAVSLVVRYDPMQQAYRFEFRDEDNPGEVHSNLAYDPAPLVEQLIADLDSLARGRSGYSADQTHDYLVNAGARLWRQLIPGQLREQFWDRQDRIQQLTILTDKDAVPWEMLYPMDPGHDAGFLVQQFPVTRAIFGWRPARTLRLRPTRFVAPEGSLPEALVEIEAIRRLLDPGQAPSDVISALTPLTDLIGRGDFGLLHFACHNTYEPVGGCSIRLGKVHFTPTLLEVAVIQKALKRSAPTVFINACRSAGLAATYNRLDGWAGSPREGWRL